MIDVARTRAHNKSCYVIVIHRNLNSETNMVPTEALTSLVDEPFGHDYRACAVENCNRCQSLVDDGVIFACDECGLPGDSDAPGGWVLSADNLIYCSKCATKLAMR